MDAGLCPPSEQLAVGTAFTEPIIGSGQLGSASLFPFLVYLIPVFLLYVFGKHFVFVFLNGLVFLNDPYCLFVHFMSSQPAVPTSNFLFWYFFFFLLKA